MRLVDKWILHVKKRVPDVLNNPPVSFVVDNIARDYYHNDRDEFDANDFPYAVPPWDLCFVEWSEPKTIKRDGCVYPTQILMQDAPSSGQSGAFVTAYRGQNGCRATLKMIELLCEKADQWQEFYDKASQSERVFTAQIFTESNGKFTDFETCLFVFTNDDGKANCNIAVGNGLKRLKENGKLQRANNWFQSVYHILAFAFTFAHCKNVKTVDETEAMQPRAKIMRRLGLPCVKRYTLKIDGGHSNNGESRGTGQSPAYHLCRGHFANYTADKPLFGRLVGKFWVPAHTKGNRKSGTIEKSYAT